MSVHVQDTVQAIAEVHLQHHRQATAVQRALDRMTNMVGRPLFIALMSGVFATWIAIDLLLQALGRQPFDPPPFQGLQNLGTFGALYIAVLILITQRREYRLTEQREQLTLELALLAEQKTAKIIALLEELRRDHPEIPDRADAEAAEMSKQADPRAVLDVINDTHEQDASGM